IYNCAKQRPRYEMLPVQRQWPSSTVSNSSWDAPSSSTGECDDCTLPHLSRNRRNPQRISKQGRSNRKSLSLVVFGIFGNPNSLNYFCLDTIAITRLCSSLFERLLWEKAFGENPGGSIEGSVKRCFQLSLQILPFFSSISSQQMQQEVLAKLLTEPHQLIRIEQPTSAQFQINPSDQYYLLVGTGGTEQDIIAFVAEAGLSPPITLVSYDLNNSLPAAMEARKALEQAELETRIIHGTLADLTSLFQRLEQFLNVREQLQNSRIGLVGVPSEWLVASQVDDQAIRETWGSEIIAIPISELIEATQQKKPDAPSNIGQRYLSQDTSNEILPEKVVEAEMVTEQLLQLVQTFNLDALTVECFSLVQQTAITSCLALSYLNDQGIIAGCEGDIPSVFTMLLLQLLTGETPWMANVVDVDVKQNRIQLAHCTIATSLLESFSLTTHFETGKSVAVRGRFKSPQDVTILKIWGPNLSSWWITKGEIVTSTTKELVCRTQIEIAVEQPVDYFLKSSLANHHCLILGDYVEAIQEFLVFIFK
ncbi:MAG: hypothetical protein ACXACI_18525, partial [Candidatus Hodarchaeales archaeon]